MSKSSSSSSSSKTSSSKNTTTTKTPTTPLPKTGASVSQVSRYVEPTKPTVTTPTKSTTTTPGYNASQGYYAGSAGQSDEARTKEAINYYRSQGMTSQLNNALNYAQSKGYNTPSTLPKTGASVSQVSRYVEPTKSTTPTNSSGLMSKAVSAVKSAAQNVSPYVSAANRAVAEGVNAVLGIGGGKDFEHNPYYRPDTGNASLNQKADWVGENVLSWLVPAGGAAKVAKGANLASKAFGAADNVSGLASKAFNTAVKGADETAGLASKAFSTVGKAPATVANVMRNAPTAVKVGVPAVAIGGAVLNQANKEMPQDLISNLQNQDIEALTTQPTGAQSPNTMTVPTGMRTSGGYTMPGGNVNNMSPGVAPNNEVDMTGQMPSNNNMPFMPGMDFLSMLNMMGMNQQPNQPIEIMQPEMPDFLAQQQEMMALIDQLTQQNQAMSMQYLNEMTSQLDQLENEIVSRYQQQGTELDPATMSALSEIRNQVDMRRQGLMEEMNRRGVLQSGIWLEEENRILSNQLTAEERLLSSRLSEAQNNIMNAIGSFAQQRMNIMGSSFQNQMNLMNNSATLQTNALQNFQNQQNQWAQWQAQQQAAAQESAAKAATSQQNQQMDLAKWLYEQQTKQANADRAFELDRMQTDYNVNKPYYSPNTGGASMSATEKKNSALADAYSAVDQAKNSGLSNDQIAQNVMGQYSELTRYGVDPNGVLDYLYQRYPDQNAGGNWYTQLDEKLGGWLPFGAGR